MDDPIDISFITPNWNKVTRAISVIFVVTVTVRCIAGVTGGGTTVTLASVGVSGGVAMSHAFGRAVGGAVGLAAGYTTGLGGSGAVEYAEGTADGLPVGELSVMQLDSP